ECAIALYRQRLDRAPGDPELAVALARTQVAAKKNEAAAATIALLRRRAPAIAEDPRLDLLESELAGDFADKLAALERASARARARGARRLHARILTQVAWGYERLTDPRGRAAALEAKEIYGALGDRAGVANALNALAPHDVSANAGVAHLEEAARVYLDVGDLNAAYGAYHNLVYFHLGVGDVRSARQDVEALERLRGESSWSA